MGKRRKRVSGRATKETKVPVGQRILEFPDQGLNVSAGMIVCVPCKEPLANIKDSLKRHLRSTKHMKKAAMCD